MDHRDFAVGDEIDADIAIARPFVNAFVERFRAICVGVKGGAKNIFHFIELRHKRGRTSFYRCAPLRGCAAGAGNLSETHLRLARAEDAPCNVVLDCFARCERHRRLSLRRRENGEKQNQPGGFHARSSFHKSNASTQQKPAKALYSWFCIYSANRNRAVESVRARREGKKRGTISA